MLLFQPTYSKQQSVSSISFIMSTNINIKELTLKEAATIESLCDDVLVEIFTFLSATDVKNAALVCKTWNNAIGSSAVVMDKFSLQINKKTSVNFSKRFRSNRKHQNVKLQGRESTEGFTCTVGDNEPEGEDEKVVDGQIHFKRASKILGHFDISQVRNFNLVFDGETICGVTLLKVLSRVPLLHKLVAEVQAIDVTNIRWNLSVTLPKLQLLSFNSIDAEIFKYVEASNITAFESYTNFKSSHGSDFSQHLIPFLNKCHKLEKMFFNEEVIGKLYATDGLSRTTFPLTTFVGVTTSYDYFKNHFLDQNFAQFLVSNASSLQTLHLNLNKTKYADEVIEAYFKLRRLETLRIFLWSFPESCTYIQPQISLKKLDIHGIGDSARKFYRKCPNIEDLDISTDNDDVKINKLAISNKELIRLKMKSVKNRLADELKFEKLKYLEVDNVDNVDDWLNMIANCPKIENIEISYESDDDDNLITDDVIERLLVSNGSTLKYLY